MMRNMFTRLKAAYRVLTSRAGIPDELDAAIARLVTPNMVPGQPAPWQFERREQVRHFKRWVYVGLNAICLKSSQQQIRFKRGIKDIADTHPLPTLFNRINDAGDTQPDWIYETVLHLHLTGISYTWKIRNGFGVPAAMWCIPSHWVKTVPGKNRLVDHYIVDPTSVFSEGIKVPAEDIMRVRMVSPLSKVEGWSAIQAGAEWIDSSTSIDKSRWSSFDNGAWPGLWIKLGATYGDPSDKLIRRLQAKFDAKFGGTENAGKPIISKDDMDLVPLTTTPREMDYGTSSNQMRDSILALLGVPKMIAGISEDVNFASANAAMVIFCANKVQPILNLISSAVTESIASEFKQNITAYYDECAPNNPDLMREHYELGLKFGTVAPDEHRQDVFGLPPLPDGLGELPRSELRRRPLDEEAPAPVPIGVGGGEEEDRDEEEDEKKEESNASIPPQRRLDAVIGNGNGNGHSHDPLVGS